MNSVLLMASPAEGGNGLMGLIPWIGVFIVFYFFMIRPQMKKNKALKEFRETLKKGDKVVTVGGIHGKIKDISETSVVIDSEGTTLRVEKSALSVSGVAELANKK